MSRSRPASPVWLLGRDRARTRRFVAGAVALCGLTVALAAAGDALLAAWPRLYAHLVIESVAVLVFAGTVCLATANAYVNDGLLPSLAVTVAPAVGLFLYLAVDSVVFGAASLAPLTLASLLSFGMGVGAVALASYLLGIMLSLLRPSGVGWRVD